MTIVIIYCLQIALEQVLQADFMIFFRRLIIVLKQIHQRFLVALFEDTNHCELVSTSRIDRSPEALEHPYLGYCIVSTNAEEVLQCWI